MSEISDKLKKRVAQTLARMDRSDMIVANVKGSRMPEAFDDFAALYDGTHDELMHDVMRAVRCGLKVGDLQRHDVVEYLATHLPRGLRVRAARYCEIQEKFGDERH